MPIVLTTPFQAGPNWVNTITFDGPLLWWRLGAAGTVTDISGNGYDGSTQGAGGSNVAGAISGDPDQAWYFNSSMHYYRNAEVGFPTIAQENSSVECFFNYGAPFGPTGFAAILSLRPFTAEVLTLNMNRGSTGFVSVEHVNTTITSPLNTYNDNNWHHIVGVKRTGASPSDVDIELWIDGVLVNSGPRVPVGLNSNTDSAFFQVGSNSNFAGTPGQVSNFNCDEALIWDFALTQTQIETHFLASGL